MQDECGIATGPGRKGQGMYPVYLYGRQSETVSVIPVPLANSIVQGRVVDRLDAQRQNANGIATPNTPEGVANEGIVINGGQREAVLVVVATVTDLIRKKKR